MNGNISPRAIERTDLNRTTEERAKIRCSTCGCPWAIHPRDATCWRYHPAIIKPFDEGTGVGVGLPKTADIPSIGVVNCSFASTGVGSASLGSPPGEGEAGEATPAIGGNGSLAKAHIDGNRERRAWEIGTDNVAALARVLYDARAEIGRLRAVIGPFARLSGRIPEHWEDHECLKLTENGEQHVLGRMTTMCHACHPTIGDWRRLGSAIEAAPPTPVDEGGVDPDPGLTTAMACGVDYPAWTTLGPPGPTPLDRLRDIHDRIETIMTELVPFRYHSDTLRRARNLIGEGAMGIERELARMVDREEG